MYCTQPKDCTITGAVTERVERSLGFIGPAVFYGGFSTFLAFVLLAGSASYVFKTFFKVTTPQHTFTFVFA